MIDSEGGNGLGILALLVLGFGVLAHQGRFVQRELWRIRQEFRELRRNLRELSEVEKVQGGR